MNKVINIYYIDYQVVKHISAKINDSTRIRDA